MAIELYIHPDRYEELREYLRACSIVSKRIETAFDNDCTLDEMEEYEHAFKQQLMQGNCAPAFDDSTDSGDCELIESAFGLIGGAVELEGYDANGVKIIWTIVPIPVGWYAPGVAP